MERVFRIFGVLSAVVALGAILAAAYFTPGFSWTGNWISDLGGANEPGRMVATETGAMIFNFGLVVSGLLGLGFAYGLARESRVGGTLLGLGAAALAGVGAFPGSGPFHTELSIMFFVFALLSMVFVGIGSRGTGKGKVTLILWAFGVPWTLLIMGYAAVPELIAISTISMWVLFMGISKW